MNQDWVNDWFPLGVTSDIPVGAVIRKRIDQFDLALFNVDGEIFARTDACGRCRRPLSEGTMVDSEVKCASCGIRVQIAQSNDSSTPAAFPVMLVDDEVFVWIDRTSDTSST